MINKKPASLFSVKVAPVISKYVNHHSSCSTCNNQNESMNGNQQGITPSELMSLWLFAKRIPKTEKVRKPFIKAKLKSFTIPNNCRNISEGVLNAFASGWTSPAQIADAMDPNIIKTKQPEDIFNMLADFFYLSIRYIIHSKCMMEMLNTTKYLGANSDVVFSWCEDHVKSYQDGQREVDFWLNTTTSHYSDGVGRVDGNKEVLLMESSSSYQTENFEHSLEDTYKLIKLSTSSLYEIIKRRQNCKAESASHIAVYSIQCIKDKLSLMKTTLDSKLERYQIVELRSCNVPTAWKDRLGILRVFELLTCLYHELKDQRELERVLLRQESRITPVHANESVRHFLTCARLASNEE